MGILIGGTIIGRILYGIFPGDDLLEGYISITGGDFFTNLTNFSNWIRSFSGPINLMLGYWMICYIALVVSFIWSYHRVQHSNPSQKKNNTLLVVDTFLAFLPLVNILAIIAIGEFDGQFSTRYLLPATILPLVTGWVFLLSRFEKVTTIFEHKVFAISFATILILFIGYTFPFREITATKNIGRYTDPWVECIKQQTRRRGLEYGIAQYWQAKYLSALMENDPMVVQVNSDLSIYHWINNIEWYNNRFEFVIVDNRAPESYRLSIEEIIDRFGEPAEVFTCGNSDVMVYNRDSDDVFQTQYINMLSNVVTK